MQSDMPLNIILTELEQLSHSVLDMPRRVELCRRALALLSKSQDPQLWATLQVELASSLIKNPLGNRSDNIEAAIAACKQALTEWKPDTMPIKWAETMMYLGNAYVERIKGDKAEDIKKAIDVYNEALDILPKADDEQLWAALQNALGNALKRYYQENWGENIEKAIDAYKQALEVRTQNAMPIEWAQTMMNLGNAYRNRIKDDKEENIEKAIQSHNQALTVQYTVLVDWADTMNSLGNAYRDRIAGDRAENIEKAIVAYNQALTVRQQQSHLRVEWAQTMMNLGNALAERIRGDKAKNIEAAIVTYNQTLTVRQQSTMPVAWAITQMNLGNAYRNRLMGNRAENIELAIKALDLARTEITQSNMPADWAIIMNNLGNAYAERMREDKAENIEKAIDAYKQAMVVRTRSAMPLEWAQTMMNLGNAYAERQGDKAKNIEEAIKKFEQALEIRKRAVLPAEHRLTQRNLGNMYFRERRWEDAAKSYAAAIEAGKYLLETAFTDAGRRGEVSETAALYVNAAYCQLQLNNYSAALVQLEAGKTRLLTEALALADAKLESLSEEQRSVYQTARKAVRELEGEYRLPPNTPTRRDDQTLSALLESERARLREIIVAIRQQNPDFLPEGLKLPDILRLIPNGGALVMPLFTSQGSAVFIIPHGLQTICEDHVIRLNDFTTDDLNKLLVGTEEKPGWLRAYINYSRQVAPDSTWHDFLKECTGKLWDVLVGKIYDKLNKLGIGFENEIILMPQGGLGLLPLHAAWRLVDEQPRSLLDDYVIRYAPSAYTLDTAQRRLSQYKGDRTALIAGVSQYHKLSILPNANAEVVMVANQFTEQFAEQILPASRSAILETAPGKTYLHLTCHGAFAWGDAFASALYLANDEPLTLAEIMSKLDLNSVRLVTLSACETGITDVRQSPDEYLGLPAGFMQTGAPGVVSSLWTVAELSTMLLMERFYQFHLQCGFEPAVALRKAQLWLRDATRKEIVDNYKQYLEGNTDKVRRYAEDIRNQLIETYKRNDKPYSNPFYWSAFIYNGI